MNYKTYEWNRTLPNGVTKFEHYQSLEKLISSITENVETDIICTCCSSMAPVLMFFENFNKVKSEDFTWINPYRGLWGTENNISFYVDARAENQTLTFETNGEVFAVIKDTWIKDTWNLEYTK